MPAFLYKCKHFFLGSVLRLPSPVFQCAERGIDLVVLKQGIDVAQVYQTLQAFMGGSFINFFNRFGRQWRVYVEAEGNGVRRFEAHRIAVEVE